MESNSNIFQGRYKHSSGAMIEITDKLIVIRDNFAHNSILMTPTVLTTYWGKEKFPLCLVWKDKDTIIELQNGTKSEWKNFVWTRKNSSDTLEGFWKHGDIICEYDKFNLIRGG
jgi:hypothetical protein